MRQALLLGDFVASSSSFGDQNFSIIAYKQ
jgi:hypothetical protein